MTTEDARTLTEVLRRCDENLIRAEAAEAKLAEAENRANIERVATENRGGTIVTLTAKLADAERKFNEAVEAVEDIAETHAKYVAAAESHEKALASENQKLRGELLDATRSLEWMAKIQPPTEDQPSASDLRQYAASRAKVARAALAAGKETDHGHAG